MYIVISKPKRRSIADGVSHFIAVSCYVNCWNVSALLVKRELSISKGFNLFHKLFRRLFSMTTTLFPDARPACQAWLDVGAGHRLYFQTSGNPQGIPVVWLHGGPGSSSTAFHRRFLNPSKFWIIQFDQRGCGKSEPSGGIVANQTHDLISDIERLREHLGLARWHVVGGSWGGTLALIYAQAHPNVVARVLLRSPFLCTPLEIDNYMEHPPEACRDLWRLFKNQLPINAGESMLACCYRVFCEEQDQSTQTRIARAWVTYESAMNLFPKAPSQSVQPTQPPQTPDTHNTADDALIARYRVHSHYLQHRCFVDGDVFAQPQMLRSLDLTIVHGEADALCPFKNSLTIEQMAPQTRLIRVAGSGHDLSDKGILAATFAEIERWAVAS
jgi:proline iminopeptidase